MEKKVKTIAFYLPQFHTIPENDMAYGKGFTEWTNTKKAKPLFEGHLQPKTPLNENYYCLLDDGVMQSQAELAKKYGIYGFCYYHYWFNGKKLLEKPIEKMLADKSIDIPFCLCWANENWTKRWDGGNNEIIVEQSYGDLEDIDKHIDYLSEYFSDERYIKIDGKPVFIIYRPEIIPNLIDYVDRIRDRVNKKGYPGLILMSQFPQFYFENKSLDLFDNFIQFQPLFVTAHNPNSYKNRFKRRIKNLLILLGMRETVQRIKNISEEKNKDNNLIIRSFDKDWKRILNYKVKDRRLIAGAFPNWDNTPRKLNGVLYVGSTPEKFEKYMHELKTKVEKEYESDFIFLNAWNEWAEGAILEPDTHYEYRYLEALKNAIDK